MEEKNENNKISPQKQKVKFIDLFAGMGGTRIGFEQAFNEAGFETECVLTSEIKETAVKALKENFNQEDLRGDIRQIDAKSIPDFDFLLGGFPCQAFSAAGKGLGFADTRGTLFFEIERILKEKHPFGFILENVEGLVLHDREKSSDKIGRTLSTILKSLENLGYKVAWRLLDSQYFGVAQSRKRVYITGTIKDYVCLDDFSQKRVVFKDVMEKGLPTVNSKFTKLLLSHYKTDELYGKSIKDKRGGDNNIHSWDIGIKGEITKQQKTLIEKLFRERRKKHWAAEIGIDWMDGMPLTVEQIATFYDSPNLKEMLDDMVKKGYLVLEHPKALVSKTINDILIYQREEDPTKPVGYNIVSGKLSFEFSKIIDSNDIAPTLVAMDVSKLGVVDGDGIRKLTLREGLRLFGYPETYSLGMFKNNNVGLAGAFDLLGNTVVVPVIKNVASRLCDIYKNN